MEQKTGWISLAVSGAFAYMAADTIHEVLGHAGMSLALGSKIDLLTSVYFKCSPGLAVVDMAGPLANLLAGVLFLMVIHKSRKISLLFFQLAVFNLFWFAGTVLQSAFSSKGDWTYASATLIGKPIATILLLIAGFSFYWILFRVLQTRLSLNEDAVLFTKDDLFRSYGFACLAAVLAGSYYHAHRQDAALEGMLEMLASVPLLLFQFKKQLVKPVNPSQSLLAWNFCVIIMYVLFCLLLGRGMSF